MPFVDPSAPSLQLFVSALSGRGRALRLAPQAAALLRERGWEVEVVVTHREDDPGQLAAASTHQWVGVFGGDGYIAHIASEVGKRGGTVIPLPGGRGNDLCRCLGIGTDALAHIRKLPQASEIVSAQGGISQRFRDVDAMRVAPLAPAGEAQNLDAQGALSSDASQVLGLVSFGLDALANQIGNESPFSSGTLAYAWGAVCALAKFKPRTMEIEVDGQVRRIRGWLVSVSNSGWFGGGINIVPTSNPSDGKLELLTVDPVPKHQAIRVLARVLTTRRVDDPIVHVETVSRVKILDSAGLIAMGDGDQVARGSVEISVQPGVFRVFA